MTGGHDDSNTMSARGKVLFNATDDLQLGFTFDYGHVWMKGIGTALVLPFAKNPWQALPDRVPPYQYTLAIGYAGLVQWDAGPVTVTYIPAYKSNDWTNQATNGQFITRTAIWDEQVTHELRVASNDADSRLRWQAGAFYYDAGNRQQLDFTLFRVDQQVDTESSALFAQANFSFTESTRATAGVRYTKDEKTEDGQNYAGAVLQGSVTDSRSSWTSWTYKLGLEQDVLESSMVYASISTGFKAGGVSLSQGPAATFDPEELTAYQAGFKSRLFDDRLSVNAEVYYYDYDNYQATYSSLDPRFGGSIRIVSNAGAAKIRGGEVESSFKITPADLLSASVAYIHGRFGTFVVPNGIGGTNDFSGSKINAPDWQLSGSYRRYFSLGDGGEISPSLSVNYRTGTFLDNRVYGPTTTPAALRGTRTGPYTYQGGVTKMDAAVSWQSASEQVQVSAYVNNLTDKASATSASRNTQGVISGYVESPRTYGVSFDIKF
jgi:iron complex outermembrane receptor protein